MRLGSLALIAVLLLGGAALFLLEGQTVGRLVLAFGLFWGIFWLALRHLGRTGELPDATIRRRRTSLLASGLLMVAAGWVAFFALWEELGLLLVVLGAVPLLLIVAYVRQEPLASPMDGPPFGETGPA